MDNRVPTLTVVDQAPAAPATALDPFDPANLRLSADYMAGTVKKLLSTIPVRKPSKQDFIRVHPSEEYRMSTAILELSEDREHYLVAPEMRGQLQAECALVTIYTAVSRQGVVFLWPCKLPAPDGRTNEWHTSALHAADLATRSWVRVRSNMALGAYEISEAQDQVSDPAWPEQPFRELLRIAFKDRFITNRDHPVVARLDGRA